jgi:hypothetical protein
MEALNMSSKLKKDFTIKDVAIFMVEQLEKEDYLYQETVVYELLLNIKTNVLL